MLEKLGGLLGWLLVFAFVGTILNYFIKIVNKRYNKKLMKLLMTVFVRNHKYFGLAAVVLLLAHFVIQFNRFGINGTGCIAAVILIIQVLLGAYATIKKRPRKGVWFIAHRVIAVLIIIGIAVHLIMPNALNTPYGKGNTYQVADTADESKLQVYTLDELSKYNGQNGNKAYIAYKGMVYDVTDVPEWKNGTHHGLKAGTDLTAALNKAPHGNSVLEGLTIVGKIN